MIRDPRRTHAAAAARSTLTMATLSLLETSSTRSVVKRPSLFTETLAEGSNAARHTTRELTIEEALADISMEGGIYDYAKNCRLSFRPETTKRNRSFIKKFEKVTGTTVISVDSAKTYLNCLLHQERHKFRNGLFRPMTKASYVDNHARLIPRWWRIQNSNMHTPGDLQYVCREYQLSANNSLPPSAKTVEFDDDSAWLLITALAQVHCPNSPHRSRTFFTNPFSFPFVA